MTLWNQLPLLFIMILTLLTPSNTSSSSISITNGSKMKEPEMTNNASSSLQNVSRAKTISNQLDWSVNKQLMLPSPYLENIGTQTNHQNHVQSNNNQLQGTLSPQKNIKEGKPLLTLKNDKNDIANNQSSPQITNLSILQSQISEPKQQTYPLLPTEIPNINSFKSYNCSGVYLSSLGACIPPECPETYTWNSSSLRCQKPPISCRKNLIWNGVSCIHPLLISNPLEIPYEYILQSNGIMCPENKSKCSKPVCPKGFVWLQRSCLPIKAGQKCPQSNLYYNFCMPNYIAEITIRERCNNPSRFGCAEVSNAIKYPNLNQSRKVDSSTNPQVNQTIIKQGPPIYANFILSKQQANLVTKAEYQKSLKSSTSNLSIVTFRNQQTSSPSIPMQSPMLIHPPIQILSQPSIKTDRAYIDYTIPGAASPIVKTFMTPSYIPNPIPRYIF